jgi:protein-L-isoaspartate(D-aspartate) O-methyltransferase
MKKTPVNIKPCIYLACLLISLQTGCKLRTFDSTLKYDEQRKLMVETQIKDRGIKDTSVLKAMMTVRREEFVTEQYRYMAYYDMPLPIGEGQTISQPYIVAYMTEAIKPQRNHKVLEIGTGSGYQAAVLAEIVDSVCTIEIIPVLADTATVRLNRLGYTNVKIKTGDGYLGWEEYAPFDAIVVTCGADEIPKPLTDQLKEGGKMVIPVGEAGKIQTLKLLEKHEGKIITTALLPVRFVPLVREKN